MALSSGSIMLKLFAKLSNSGEDLTLGQVSLPAKYKNTEFYIERAGRLGF